jgi:hypothetical protein
VGAGKAYYLGWYPSDAQAEAIITYLAYQAGVVPLATVPEGMIISQHGPHLILLNFTDEPQEAVVQGRTFLVGSRDVKIVTTD